MRGPKQTDKAVKLHLHEGNTLKTTESAICVQVKGASAGSQTAESWLLTQSPDLGPLLTTCQASVCCSPTSQKCISSKVTFRGQCGDLWEQRSARPLCPSLLSPPSLGYQAAVCAFIHSTFYVLLLFQLTEPWK